MCLNTYNGIFFDLDGTLVKPFAQPYDKSYQRQQGKNYPM